MGQSCVHLSFPQIKAPVTQDIMCFACLRAPTVFFPEKEIKEDLFGGHEFQCSGKKQMVPQILKCPRIECFKSHEMVN